MSSDPRSAIISEPFAQPTWLVVERPGFKKASGFLEAVSARRCSGLFSERQPPLLPVGSKVTFWLTCLAMEVSGEPPDRIEGHVVARTDSELGLLYALSTDAGPCSLTGAFPRQLGGVERRGARRVPMTLLAELVGGAGLRCPCQLTDLSETGAALRVSVDDEALLATCLSLELRFARPAPCPETTEVLVAPLRVIHRRLVDGGGVRYGAAFLTAALRPEERRALRRFVLERQRVALTRR